MHIRRFILAAVALGLFLVALAAGGYLAERIPTPVALAVCLLAIGVVLVRLSGRSS